MNKELPEALLGAYQRAKGHVDERRYEEALGAYREALRIDPANLQIRLEVAGLYQKLALWLDALEMYRHVVVLAQRKLLECWRLVPTRRLRVQRRAARRALLSAQYRCTVSLAWGELLSEQWLSADEKASRTGPASARSKELLEVRERLQETISDHLRSPPRYKGLMDGRREPLKALWEPGQRERQAAKHALRLIFQLMARDEAHHLRTRFRDARWRKGS
jgi:tetratricopeptide (TPR) repeat protein